MNAAQRTAFHENQLWLALVPILATKNLRDPDEHDRICEGFKEKYKISTIKFNALIYQWESVISGGTEYDPAAIY